MGWEKRRGGKRYYTRTKRSENGYVREYVGRGPKAQAAAEADAQQRQERKCLRQVERRAQQDLREKAAALQAYCRETDRRLRLALVAQGYHQHARGIWRKKRMAIQTSIIECEALDFDWDTIQTLRDAQEGNPIGAIKLEELFEKKPQLAEQFGDLTKYIRVAWIDLIAGYNHLVRKCLDKSYPERVQALLGPQPSELERQLAERVVLCGLQAEFADIQYAEACKTGESRAQHSHMLKFQTTSHNRLLSAMKALANMKKLLRPAPSAYEVAMKASAASPEASVPSALKQRQEQKPCN